LTSQAYTVIEAASGQEALSGAATQKPDIIILDLGLPDIDGVGVTRLLRQWTQIPIIILSVRGSEEDKIAALDAGADDYLTKPFGVGELLARLRAALRRTARTANEPVFTSGNLKVDLARRLITVSGREVQLTPTEYGLLRVLITHAGKVLTHHHLLREVWGAEYGEEFHMLHVNISNLRRKIEPDPARPQFIITEPGVGYRLRAD
jgi:two-component system KDP operon response regulator KdpE